MRARGVLACTCVIVVQCLVTCKHMFFFQTPEQNSVECLSRDRTTPEEKTLYCIRTPRIWGNVRSTAALAIVFVMTSFSFPSSENSTCDTSLYQLTQWLHCVRCRFFLVRESLLLLYASYLLFTCTHLKELTVGCLAFSMIWSQNRKYTCFYVGLTYESIGTPMYLLLWIKQVNLVKSCLNVF